MVKTIISVIGIFYLCVSVNNGFGLNSDPNDIDPRSLKNWFMRDFKISTERVTMNDLLKSPGTDWLLYHGDFGANHYSPLSEINRSNVGRLVPKWTYKITDGANLRSAPIVYRGGMYVTAANEIHAVDTKTGQWLLAMASL